MLFDTIHCTGRLVTSISDRQHLYTKCIIFFGMCHITKFFFLQLSDYPCLHFSETWWRHQMETFSALLTICAGNTPVTGEFPSQRPVTRSFDVFFDLRLNKRLSKQSCPLWRHCNDRHDFSFHYDWSLLNYLPGYSSECVPSWQSSYSGPYPRVWRYWLHHRSNRSSHGEDQPYTPRAHPNGGRKVTIITQWERTPVASFTNMVYL